MQIIRDPLESPAVIGLLEEHLADMYATSPPESVHALDVSKLKAADVHFWTAWQDDMLLGCVALKQHNATMGELKSMRSTTTARGKGVGRALLQHVELAAAELGITQLYLETGSMAFFLPARRLYESAGFVHCGPFADYTEDPLSTYMHKDLAAAADVTEPVSRQLQAYNAKDLAAFVRCYHPDVQVFRMPTLVPVLHGIDAFSQFYATARFTLPALQAKVLSRMVVGNKVIEHELVSGITEQPYEVAVVYEVEQGLITQVWFYPAS
jgi:putative acetyltransferase